MAMTLTATTPTSAPATIPTGESRQATRLGLPTLAVAVGSIHFVVRVGGLVQPMLVLYLTQEQQMSSTAAGTVVAAVGIGDLVSMLLGGWLGDRIGRRRTMILGFLGSAGALIELGTTDTAPSTWVAALVFGLASELFYPAASAAVADLPPELRVRSYSLVFWLANVGYSLAAVTAGALASHGFDVLFWVNGAAMLVAAAIAWAAVPDTVATHAGPTRALLPALLADRLMVTMILIFLAVFTLQYQTVSTLPLRMTAAGHDAATYGAVLALNGLAIVLLQPVGVAVLSRRNRGNVLAVSMLLVGAGAALTSLAENTVGFAVAVLTVTLGEIGIAIHFGAVFADIAPPDLRSRYMGVAADAFSVGSILGPIIGVALLGWVDRAWLAALAMGAGAGLCLAQRAAARSLEDRTTR
jgi:MFS family permease